jgi:hypothetical protein
LVHVDEADVRKIEHFHLSALGTYDECTIVFLESASVYIAHNHTYKKCLKFVFDISEIVELMTGIYGFFIRHNCLLHVSKQKPTNNTPSLRSQTFVTASDLFCILESTIQEDISIQQHICHPQHSVNEALKQHQIPCIRRKQHHIPCTRQTWLGCARTSAYIQASPKSKETICYNNGYRHLLGQQPKTKPVLSLRSFTFPKLRSSVVKG